MSSKPEMANKVAYKIVKDQDIILYKEDFYKYNNWIWECIELKEEINCNIYDLFMALSFPIPDPAIITMAKSYIWVYSFKQYQKTMKQLSNNKFNGRKWEVNLRSWVYDLATNTTRPYTKEDLVFKSLPFDYNPSPEYFEENKHWVLSTSVFKQFLKSTFYNEDYKQADWQLSEEWRQEQEAIINLIQEWFWYSLLRFNPLEKSLIQFWEWRNWKWTLNEVWKRIIWDNNYSTLALQELNDPWFIWRTKNMFINFSDDLDHSTQLDTWLIKSAISWEEVTSNRKFKDQEQFYFTAKLIMAWNKLPYLKNAWTAVKERFHVLTFKNEFTEENGKLDINLKSNLMVETEWVFYWAMEGLQRLYKNKKFSTPDCVKEDINAYIEEYDLVSLWIEEDENLKFWPSRTERPQKLYDQFSSFWLKSGKHTMSKPSFYRKLEKLGYQRRRFDWYQKFIWIQWWKSDADAQYEFMKW